jgi:ABC-type uncharacterized transport system substrate-binding protein
MKRREFITLFCGSTFAVWPLVSFAQQLRIRRIGILLGTSENDPEAQRRVAAFVQSLREIGWTDGKEITFEKRYSGGNPERLQSLAAELVQSKVDVIVTEAAQAVDAARKATANIPIVMSYIGDALASGYVATLARPGGNVTGQTLVATDQAAKRLELIKSLMPGIQRVAILSNGRVQADDRSRRFDELWSQPGRHVAAQRILRRQNIQRSRPRDPAD